MNIFGLIVLIILIGVAFYFDNRHGEPGKPELSVTLCDMGTSQCDAVPSQKH